VPVDVVRTETPPDCTALAHSEHELLADDQRLECLLDELSLLAAQAHAGHEGGAAVARKLPGVSGATGCCGWRIRWRAGTRVLNRGRSEGRG
jgi:hypothetical protein